MKTAPGVTLDRGRYWWVKRVPRRFAGLVLGDDGQPVSQVRVCLFTDSREEANRKAPKVAAAKMAEWEAIAAGNVPDARAYFEATRKLATERGFSYVPIADLASGDLADLVRRVLSLSKGGDLASPAAVAAVLGGVAVPVPTLPEILEEYYALTKTRHLKKSPQQAIRWKNSRDRAVRTFLEVVATRRDAYGAPIPEPVDKYTRADALRYRKWWSERVQGGMSVSSANKCLGQLSEIYATWHARTESTLPNPFTAIALEGKDSGSRPPFSREWVRERLLAPGAMASLNEEARDVFLMMINTGLRPAEIMDAPGSDFMVAAPVPFFRVAENGRELKVAHTARDIPLLGVSLDAAQRLAGRGGCQRYRHKASGWSALVGKYLRVNGLAETPAHVPYSLRHYVEDALLSAGVDDRVRADILGHKYARPNYGNGGGLEGRRTALQLIAL